MSNDILTYLLRCNVWIHNPERVEQVGTDLLVEGCRNFVNEPEVIRVGAIILNILNPTVNSDE